MHAIEVTIQNLIGSGMDPKTENNPYLGFVYTSFQERATKVGSGCVTACSSLLFWPSGLSRAMAWLSGISSDTNGLHMGPAGRAFVASSSVNCRRGVFTPAKDSLHCWHKYSHYETYAC
jgi:hypothetical protein